MTLQNVLWRPVYKSGFGRDEMLMDAFNRLLLCEAVRYRLLGDYLTLRSLVNALENVDSLLKTEVQECAVEDGIAEMGLQECYYWLAKAGSPTCQTE